MYSAGAVPCEPVGLLRYLEAPVRGSQIGWKLELTDGSTSERILILFASSTKLYSRCVLLDEFDHLVKICHLQLVVLQEALRRHVRVFLV
jgi:hypothetical protein